MKKYNNMSINKWLHVTYLLILTYIFLLTDTFNYLVDIDKVPNIQYEFALSALSTMFIVPKYLKKLCNLEKNNDLSYEKNEKIVCIFVPFKYNRTARAKIRPKKV